jgi:predicted dehydrogenase/threonine dehydrogenase-like Zn-dependent dehydrogenase
VKQVAQPTSGGPVRVLDVPSPSIGPTEVLVKTAASVVSPGTERAVTGLARSSLVAKARARPDLVRQVLRRARADGLAETAKMVRARLDDLVPLGYSAAGVAVEVGEAVAGIAPGQLVATAGGGRANHAEFQSVPGLLCAPVPEGIPAEDAAFSTLASIALHGLRLSETGPGSKVVVIGLGLIGQLAVRVAQAAGCDVAAIDVNGAPVGRASAAGALGLVERGEETTRAVLEWSRGRGADAVLLTAAGSSSDAVRRAPELCRDGASVVIVGDVGLHLERRPFYERELSLRVARSYGPGRHERSYEEWGVDLPAGLVRWTEGRNLEAVLDLQASGRLQVADLITHRFPVDDAPSAYEMVEKGSEPFVGIVLTYGEGARVDEPVRLRPRTPQQGEPGVGLVGAGNFASSVLLPALREAGFNRMVAVASASGLSARRLAERAEFEQAAPGAGAVIDDPDVDVVVVATPHDTHAQLAAQGLRGGKHVFCEKPLALSVEELDELETAWRESGRVLFAGFNRRWSEPLAMVRDHFVPGRGPLVVTYRVNAGALPADHWYHDRRQGGRLLGEVCHFVDACAAIVGQTAVDVRAVGSGRGERLLDEDVIVSLRYPDGSLATITYASGGHPAVGKERVEVMGQGRTAVLDDYREVVLDGRRVRSGAADKGHRAEAVAFRRALEARGEPATETAIASTRTTLAAAAKLSNIDATPDI